MSVPLTRENLPTLYCDLDSFEFDSDTLSDANNYDERAPILDLCSQINDTFGNSLWDPETKARCLNMLLCAENIGRWDPEQESAKFTLAGLGAYSAAVAVLSKIYWEMPDNVKDMVTDLPESGEYGLRLVEMWNPGQGAEGVMFAGFMPYLAVERAEEYSNYCYQEFGILFQ